MKVLVTGGLGFIGSHTVVELLNEGYEVVVIDNLSNASIDVIDKIKKITGKDIIFYEEDVCDIEALEKIFTENQIDAVIHFAGFKAVGESVAKPIMYYENNESCVPDYVYDSVSHQLAELYKTVSKEALEKSTYYYAMFDFDGNTGFDIPSRLTKHDREYLGHIADVVYKQWKRTANK